MAEPTKNQLLRDFRRRSIFDFCNTIDPNADIALPRRLPSSTAGRGPACVYVQHWLGYNSKETSNKIPEE